MQRDFSFPVLAVCFLLSGFAALIYQTAWTREFAFIFGTSELAVATVLAAYMAGLAAGAAIAGRLQTRIRRPVLAYGLLELGVGLSALAVPFATAAATALLLRLYGDQPEMPDASHGWISLFYLVSSFLILMLPTVFMGATLPLLARHAVHTDAQIGPRVGLLYGINTAGAVLGTTLTAFVLLPVLGLRDTVYAAVAVNGLVFAVAVLLAWIAPVGSGRAAPRTDLAPTGVRWILPLIAVSGVVSFTYEVLWTRLLGHVVGNSVYAFATMLGSFLLGIALGSAIGSRYTRTREQALRGFSLAQLGSALLSWGAFLLADQLPALRGAQFTILNNTMVAMAVLLPAALCIGATYPLAVRLHAGGADDAGSASARVYAWNTAGAIVGALAAAYWLLPTLGYAGVATLGIATSLALGLLCLVLGRSRSLWIGGALLAAAVALAALPPGLPMQLLRASPISSADKGDLEFFAVGRSSTVMTTTNRRGAHQLRTNGLPEAAISEHALFADASKSHMLGVRGVLLHPEARSLAVVGFGGGVAVERIPSTIEEIHVVELEPEVIRANRELSALRALDPLADPRVRVIENDARSALLLTGRSFDVIVAQPSHPWTAGASHLYTREFFELIASRLAPGGVFVQWMGVGFVDESLLRSIIRSLGVVWPHVRVYRAPPTGALHFVASDRPFRSAEETLPPLLEDDPETMARLGMLTPIHLDAELLLDEDGARLFAKGAQVISDDRNLLQMRSPLVTLTAQTIGRKPSARMAALDAIRKEADAQRAFRIAWYLIETGERKRSRALLAKLTDPANRRTGAALLMLLAGKLDAGVAQLRDVLARNPAHPYARAALRRYLPRVGGSVSEAPLLGPEHAPEAERILIRAQHISRDADASGLKALDAELAGIPAASPYFAEAAARRLSWRIARKETGPVGDRIAAQLFWSGRRHPQSSLVPARYALAAGDAAGAAAGVLTILDSAKVLALTRSELAEVRSLLNAIPVEPEIRTWITAARDMLAELAR